MCPWHAQAAWPRPNGALTVTDAHGRAGAAIAPQGRAEGGRGDRRRAGAKAQAALDTSNQLHVYKYRYKTRFFCVGGEPRRSIDRHTHTLSAVEFTVFVVASM